MRGKSLLFLLGIFIMWSFLCLQAYAESDKQKILGVADQIYQNYLKQLRAIQQQGLLRLTT